MKVPLLILAALAGTALHGQQLAFPGAEGFGRFASGGRGGAVIEVTNLNDSGPGSLRAAIDASGPRTVVFRVSGTIYLNNTLRIGDGDITIAGQTAPGDGITIARRGLQVSGARNVIIRFIRVRLGDLYPRDNNLSTFESDAFECRYSTNVIVDHCSFSWSIDETATAYNNRDFTMQWCIASEALHNSFHSKGNHGYGGIWGGRNATFHHNLLAHHRSRLPRFNGARYSDYAQWGDGEVDHRNNVIYNWSDNSAYGAEPNNNGFRPSYNIVGNTYKPGPATSSSKNDRIIAPDINSSFQYAKLHISGNYTFGTIATSRDNWKGVDNVAPDKLEETRFEEPFPMPEVDHFPALEAYGQVLAHAGASFPARDSVDVRVVDEVRSGTGPNGNNGLIDSQDEVGGYPELASLPAPEDSDHDGMPDAWEIEKGLDPQDPTDRNGDLDGDGYTNLEEYLNGLVADLHVGEPLLTYDDWAALALWDPFNDAAGDADPDGDGVSSFEEFAYLGDPRLAEPGAILPVFPAGASLDFSVRRGTALLLELQTTTDLSNWTTLWSLGDDPEFPGMTVEKWNFNSFDLSYSTQLGDAESNRFWRIRVMEPPVGALLTTP